jgi:hypothetical protein
MQKIKPLVEQASKELKKGSSASLTAVGQSSHSATGTASAEVAEPAGRYGKAGTDDRQETPLDQVDAINQVFAEFEFAYHNQFHKAFSDAESLVIAKKYWLSSLENYSPRHIVQAAKRVVKTQEYLPSIAAMLKACEQGFDLYGLPSPRQAYEEACRASSPKQAWNWSHEAVYFAGKATGWFMLANEPESKAFPVFNYHYGLLCQQVVEGKELHIEAPPALTEKVERSLSREEQKERIARLRAELKL